MATIKMRLFHRVSACFVLLFAVLNGAKCDEQVPLMLWTSEGVSLPSQSPPTAGHIVGQDQLHAYLHTALRGGPRNVLLFLQDKLSIEDFTMYGGAFGNKQDNAFPNLEGALLSSPSPLVLPAVYWPASNEVIGQVLSTMKTQSVPYVAIYTALRPSQEAAAAALSLEAGVGGGRSLLQASHKERERERRRGKEKPDVHSPVEFK
ncbi:hypothetical protein CRUP_015245, partial [Coryphaenoides rupestris]